MKRLSCIFTLLALVLSHVACIVVAYDYRDMLCGIAHGGYSAPAWVVFFELIPFGLGIILCVVLAMVFHKKSKE